MVVLDDRSRTRSRVQELSEASAVAGDLRHTRCGHLTVRIYNTNTLCSFDTLYFSGIRSLCLLPFLNPLFSCALGFSGPGDTVRPPSHSHPTLGLSLSSPPSGSNSTFQHASSRHFLSPVPRWLGLGARHCLRG